MVRCGAIPGVLCCVSILVLLYGVYNVWTTYSLLVDPANLIKTGFAGKSYKPGWAASKSFSVDPDQFGEEGKQLNISLDGGYMFIETSSGKSCDEVFKKVEVKWCLEGASCTDIAVDKNCRESQWSGYTTVGSFRYTSGGGDGTGVWQITSQEVGLYWADYKLYSSFALSGFFGVVGRLLVSGVLLIYPVLCAACFCCCSFVACLMTPSSEGTAAQEPMQMQMA